MGDILKGLEAPNGKVLEEIIADGWGSIAKVQVDKTTGDILNIERQETP
jgi:hypothetical protein